MEKRVYGEIKNLMEKREETVVRLLSSKFGFDFDEALSICNEGRVREERKTVSTSPKKKATTAKKGPPRSHYHSVES